MAELPARPHSMGAIGLPNCSELPKSPCSTPPIQCAYRMGSGRFRPIVCPQTPRSAAGVAVSPEIATATSPGSTLTMPKVSIDTMNSTTTSNAVRRRMNSKAVIATASYAAALCADPYAGIVPYALSHMPRVSTMPYFGVVTKPCTLVLVTPT